MFHRKVIVIFLFLFSFLDAKIYNVKNFGAKGDGKTDDYAAIISAVKEINNAKTGELFFPKGVYFIEPHHTKSTNYSNIIFQNVKRLIIRGKNAKIVVNGNFVRTKDYSASKYHYSKTNAIIPFSIRNCDGVLIEGLEIDGQVNKMQRRDNVAEAGNYALIQILGSKDVTLNDLYLHHSQTDGVYIAHNSLGLSQNINFNNVISSNNARQGLSIIGMIGGKFNNSQFINTGITDGKYGSHSPRAGVDIEPHSQYKVKNILFENCIFENNLGSQFTLSTPLLTENVTVKHSILRAGVGKFKYQIITSGKNVIFENNYIDVGVGSVFPMWNRKPESSVVFKNNKIKGNSRLVLAVPNKPSEQFEVIFIENEFYDNGNSDKRTGFIWMSVNGGVFKSNKIILPNGKKTQPGILIQKTKNISDNQLIDSKNKAKVLQLQ